MFADSKKRKVGFLGCSSSFRTAPIDDPEWELWACGPAMRWYPDAIDFFDVWFELHDMCDNDPEYGAVIDALYYQWLEEASKTKTVIYRPPLYKALVGEIIPWDGLASKHAPYFLDSTIAWMMALAYENHDNIDEIGLWGIDFSSDIERREQQKGTRHFIELFRLQGINCFIPETSEMAHNPAPYPDYARKKAA